MSMCARNIKEAGQLDTLRRLGISDGLVKQAFLPMLARGIMTAGKWLAGRGAGMLAKAAPKAESAFVGFGHAAPAAETALTTGQRFQGWAGKHLSNMGQGVQAAGQAFGENPLAAVGRGGLEFGKGALMMGGKGIGGAAGKGTFAVGMGNAMFGGPGAPPPPPPMPMQQAGQGFTNPYMMG